MNRVIGKCSLCGGDVCINDAYMSTRPPEPTCISCHAVKKTTLPVVQMEQPLTKRDLLLG